MRTKRAFGLKDLSPPYGSAGRGEGWCLAHKRVYDKDKTNDKKIFDRFEKEMAIHNNELEDIANLEDFEQLAYTRRQVARNNFEKRFFEKIYIEPHCQMMIDYRGMSLNLIKGAVYKFLNAYEVFMRNNYKKGMPTGPKIYPSNLEKAEGKKYPAGSEPFQMLIQGYWYVFLAENTSNSGIYQSTITKEEEDQAEEEEKKLRPNQQNPTQEYPYLKRFNTLKVITAYPDGQHIKSVGKCDFATGKIKRTASIRRVARLYMQSKFDL